MQPRSPQVGIDQQDPTIGLPDKGLRQIRSDERFSFHRKTAGNEQAAKRLGCCYLVKTRPKRPKSLDNHALVVVPGKRSQTELRVPSRARTTLRESSEGGS